MNVLIKVKLLVNDVLCDDIICIPQGQVDVTFTRPFLEFLVLALYEGWLASTLLARIIAKGDVYKSYL